MSMNTPVVSKSTRRVETTRQLAEFLARGGKVEVLPTKAPKSGARTWKRA